MLSNPFVLQAKKLFFSFYTFHFGRVVFMFSDSNKKLVFGLESTKRVFLFAVTCKKKKFSDLGSTKAVQIVAHNFHVQKKS
jgi:hypothetical protein